MKMNAVGRPFVHATFIWFQEMAAHRVGRTAVCGRIIVRAALPCRQVRLSWQPSWSTQVYRKGDIKKLELIKDKVFKIFM